MTADHSGPDARPDVGSRVEPLAVDGGGRLAHDTEFQAQLVDLRDRLLRAAGPVGIDQARVQQAIDETVQTYESAVVRSFLAVLIERDVRARLSLRTSTEPTADLSPGATPA